MNPEERKTVRFTENNQWHYYDPDAAILPNTAANDDGEEDVFFDSVEYQEYEDDEEFFWSSCVPGDDSDDDDLSSPLPAPKRPLEADDFEAPPEHEAKRLRYKQPAFSPVSAPRRSVGLQEKASKNGKRKTRCSFCL